MNHTVPIDHVERAAVEQFTAHARSFATSGVITDHAALEALAALVDARPTDAILDLACGPGIVACHLASRGPYVTGVDLTPRMLDLAAERAASTGVQDRVAFRLGAMDRIPAQDGEYTAVVSRYALHHAVDPALVAREMDRVLAPGGRIIVVDFAASGEESADREYDRAERLRDPSHVRNLTAAEQRALFVDLGYEVDATCSYQLDADLDQVLRHSHGVDHDGVRRAFEHSLDGHGMGVGAHAVGPRILFRYPIAGTRFVRSA